jgi:hypothetical protein
LFGWKVRFDAIANPLKKKAVSIVADGETVNDHAAKRLAERGLFQSAVGSWQ